MQDKTFITELNHEQVDVLNGNIPEQVIYFNVKIHWGLHIFDNMKSLDLSPFVDRIQVFCGEDARSSNKMLIISEDFLDIVNEDSLEQEWEIKYCFLRDDDKPLYQSLISILPKFVAIDMKSKVVEVLFNA